MRIRGLGRLKTQWARLRGQLTPGPMVLLYHRVAQLQGDPHLLAVSPEHFEEHLLALRQHFEVSSLSELTECLARGMRPSPVVALTFDDGYADNAEAAFPLLNKHGIPATFYLASGFVGSTRECLHHDLERLLLLSPQRPDQLHLLVAGKPFVWAMRLREAEKRIASPVGGWNMESKTDPTARHRACREIHGMLRVIPPVEREGVLEQLRSQCGDPGPARSTHRAMTWDQARQMAACELTDLGVHTVNHPYLSALPLKEQRAEILESKRALEEQIGQPVTSFAYPYGTRQSYTAETVGLLKELGFANACSNFRNRIGRLSDLFQIPRFVVGDWNGDEFLRQIRKGRL
jgi:peptidoglycan/xylan/chitin deacetylase (PgdA/CDA1 family)